MANATGFQYDPETLDIKMNAGDTGSFKIHSARASGTAWTANDRMLFTVRDTQRVVVLQRYYRLDDAFGLGNGTVLVEFHNDDTDDWTPGLYGVELRFDVDPVWSGEAPTGRCENALAVDASIIEGSVVRTVIHSSLTIEEVYGKI